MKKGIGLRYALRGLWTAICSERNMRIHITAVFYVSAYGVIAKLEPWAWCAVILCFGLVLSLETLNAALERLGDEISKENRPLIGAAKDMAAGAVLIAAVMAAAVAAIVFTRPDTWGRIAASPASLWVLAGTPVFGWFVLSLAISGKKR
jgi:diacylglycerol kinase (ATP)